MNIVAFGCSYTYGAHMGNEHNNDPSSLAWPQKLADHYKCSVNNLGLSGHSNKRILHDILNRNYSVDDVVFVCWSFLERWCVIDEETIHDIGVWQIDDIEKRNDHYTKREHYLIAKPFFENVFRHTDMTLEYFRCIMLATHYLNSIGVKNFHTCVQFDKWIDNIADKHSKWFDRKDYLMPESFEIIKRRWPKADDGHHPGPQAHAKLARRLFDYSKEQIV